jgi:hypothetical protein
LVSRRRLFFPLGTHDEAETGFREERIGMRQYRNAKPASGVAQLARKYKPMAAFPGKKGSHLVKASGILCRRSFGEIFAPAIARLERLFLSFRNWSDNNLAIAYGR